jgi:hypothetical protein
MKITKITFLIFLFITFILGMYLYSKGSLYVLHNFFPHSSEGTTGFVREKIKMENMQGVKGPIDYNPALDTCPDVLIRRGNMLLMFDTKKSMAQGSNPKMFRSMDEYIKYYNSQKEKGSQCAMLFMQEEYDTQGNQVYRVRPSPFDMGGGLSPFSVIANSAFQNKIDRDNPMPIQDASREDPPYNQNMYPGFDTSSQYQGRYSELDRIHDSTMFSPGGSLNPADPNWAGVLATQDAINKGYYDDNNVSMYVP